MRTAISILKNLAKGVVWVVLTVLFLAVYLVSFVIAVPVVLVWFLVHKDEEGPSLEDPSLQVPSAAELERELEQWYKLQGRYK